MKNFVNEDVYTGIELCILFRDTPQKNENCWEIPFLDCSPKMRV
jgi:hypothetical protein